MKQDKFLMGILAGIGILIALALVLFFTRQEKREYKPEDTPGNIVHNYVLAVLEKDYEKAYGYLADLEHKPSYDTFRRSFFNNMVNPGSAGIEIGEADISNNDAVVSVTLHYPSSDIFSGGYSSNESASLVKQNGVWKIASMPYSFWDYSWYQEPFQP